MAGQIKLTLRPPPNVEFVTGFPGIPAGPPDRPHATVKGSVELRVGQGHPIKAKWIKIDFRKVEILPGGGPTNTFYSPVGTGAFSLWTAKEEWEVVTTQDFPFAIRIPENIPPSIALENGSGIKYELVATLCYRAKKGIFRRESAPIMSNTAQIVIDKHELHSAWPIYLQPDIRQAARDGMSLIVERPNTCYGPGDRVFVRATVKSSRATIIIKSYEFTLRETAIFRGGAQDPKVRKPGPQVRTGFIGQQQVVVNRPVHPAANGGAHTVDLGCMVPSGHTSTTVVTGDHIEVIYAMSIRVAIEHGDDMVLDNIPVMMSNWPRSASIETIRRIGPAPHLSFDQRAAVQNPQLHSPSETASLASRNPQLRQPRPYSIAEKVSNRNSIASNFSGSVMNGGPGQPPSGPYPHDVKKGASYNPRMSVAMEQDEFGILSTPIDQISHTLPMNGSSNAPQSTTATAPAPATHNAPSRPASATDATTQKRPNSGTTQRANNPNRFTIVNVDAEPNGKGRIYPSAAEEKAHLAQKRASKAAQAQANDPAMTSPDAITPPPPSTSPAGHPAWPSAEAEKRKMEEQKRKFQEAREVAAAVHNGAAIKAESPPLEEPVRPVSSPKPAGAAWPSAEDEKRRIFDQAQARVQAVQSGAVNGNYAASVGEHRTQPSEDPNATATSNGSPYPQQRPIVSQYPSVGPVLAPVNVYNPVSTPSKSSAGKNLYSHAMSSINRPIVPTQTASAAPTAGYPQSGVTSARNVASPVHTALVNQPPNADVEKAQLRYLEAKRAVEQQQQHHQYQQRQPSDPVPYDALYPASSSNQPPASAYNPHASGPAAPSLPQDMGRSNSVPSSVQGLSEKERLRRHYDLQEAEASLRNNVGGGAVPAPPPRRNTIGPRSPVSPPPNHSNLPLTSLQSPSVRATSPLSSTQIHSPLKTPTQNYNHQPQQLTNGLAPIYQQQLSSIGNSQLPQFSASDRPLTAVEEKARLKAQYEGREQSFAAPFAPPVWKPASPINVAPAAAASSGLPNASEEKARLRAQYAFEDAGSRTESRAQPEQPPAWAAAPTPLVRNQSSYQRPLNAAEEKERLRAQYAAEDTGASSGAGSAQPPPLSIPQYPSPSYGAADYAQPPTSPQYNSQSPVYGSQPQTPSLHSGAAQAYNVQSSPAVGSIHAPTPQRPIPTSFADDNDFVAPAPEFSLRRDPSVSLGKMKAATPRDYDLHHDEDDDDGTVPPPPVVPPRPPAEYIRQHTQIEERELTTGSRDWESSQSSGPNDYSSEFRSHSPLNLDYEANKPPLPPKVPI